jgi:serine phosphatase RsbU (regulator of sigma subunit)
MAPLIQQIKGLFKRGLTFLLNIGADPRDSEYIRLIKRIWYVSSVVALPVSLISGFAEIWIGNKLMAGGFFLSFVIFFVFLVDGALSPNHFERNAFIVLTYFVLSPIPVTFISGGLWRSGGAIMVGLLGPLFALLFPNRRKAFALFCLYAITILALTLFPAFPRDSTVKLTGNYSIIFWTGFLILVAFVFGAMYFFVVQRDRAYRLLDEEKAKSERLLRRIESDLEQAAKIQKDLLPKENPRLEGFDISGLNVPCYEIGGDYYDFVPIDTDRLGVVIADVSGKGISASLLMASLRAALLAEVHPRCEIAQMAVRLNDFVFKSSGLSSFITFFYGELDRRSGELRYVNAGHNPPFVLGQMGRIISLPSSGFPLGMFPQATYETGAVKLGLGDVAVLYTDGIPEGRNAQSKDFTEERLRNLVLNHWGLSASQLSRRIIADVQDFSTGTEPCDDITLVIIKRSGENFLGAHK